MLIAEGLMNLLIIASKQLRSFSRYLIVSTFIGMVSYTMINIHPTLPPLCMLSSTTRVEYILYYIIATYIYLFIYTVLPLEYI